MIVPSALKMVFVHGLVLVLASATRAGPPEIVSIQKIWDQAPHNAFTDLIRSDGEWFCTFREADSHAKGKAYGISRLGGGAECRRAFLYSSTDGLDWWWITNVDVPGVSETTLRFLPDGQMVALVRREGAETNAWIGTSRPPYKNWQWHESDYRVGGPDFIRLPDGQLWAAGRRYDLPEGAKTVLARMTSNSYEPVLVLPSGGDTSYPGMVWHEDLLWMSYYSSHEGKTAIYLAKIRLGP